MSVGVWLVGRELRSRAVRTATAIALVAVAIALGTGLELLARAREEATALRIDGMGPALRLVPAGQGGSALARLDLGGELLPAGTAEATSAALGLDLREARARLVLQLDVAGWRAPVVGTGDGRADAVELGSALAERLGRPTTARLGGRELPVVAIREARGSAEDAAAFVPLATAQRLAGHAGINELQLFLRAGTLPREAAARLQRAGLAVQAISGERGPTADSEVQASLSRARRLAQWVLAVMVGLGLAVAAHLDAAERRVEVATLVAIGAGVPTVSLALLGRSIAVGAAGGLLGAFVGGAMAALADPSVAPAILRGWQLLAVAPGSGALLGLLAAAPSALATALRDPVAALQES